MRGQFLAHVSNVYVLLTCLAVPGSVLWACNRMPAMLHEPLLRPADRLDQYVSTHEILVVALNSPH